MASPTVGPCRARARVSRRHGLSVLQRAARFQVPDHAARPEPTATNLHLRSQFGRAALDHARGVHSSPARGRQEASPASGGTAEGVLAVISDAGRLQALVEKVSEQPPAPRTRTLRHSNNSDMEKILSLRQGLRQSGKSRTNFLSLDQRLCGRSSLHQQETQPKGHLCSVRIPDSLLRDATGEPDSHGTAPTRPLRRPPSGRHR